MRNLHALKYFLSILMMSLLVSQVTWSKSVSHTLFINTGSYEAIDSATFFYASFNTSSEFKAQSEIIRLNENDSLVLEVINTDSFQHIFSIDEIDSVRVEIAPGDTELLHLFFPQVGIFIYYDRYNYPIGRYLGLAGMIVVDGSDAKSFYWNLKEHERKKNIAYANGDSFDLEDYEPDYFTLNGRSNPEINSDSLARVRGEVGDTIRIYIANTGQSLHSLHFHGYHSRIVRSSKFPSHNQRSKDTFPVYSMESLILELIPHQKGEYPVHDHNLSAVSGGNYYPNGMFLTILIE